MITINAKSNIKANATLNIICALLLIIGLCVYLLSESMSPLRYLPLVAGLVLALFAVIIDFRYISKKVASRSFKYSTNALIYSIIIVSIICVINFIVQKNDKQWDLTQNKRYSLSEQSIKVLKNLKSDLTIMMFYPDIERLQFNDLFKQYTYHSDKLKIDFYDINKKPKLAEDNQITANRTALIKYNGKTEKLFNNFGEQELTNAIIRSTRASQKVIYFLSGHNEADCDDMTEKGMSAVKDAMLTQNFGVKKLNLIEKQEIPKDCSSIIIAGPKIELMETEEAMLMNYLNAGGHVFVLLDPKPSASLERLLKPFGIEAGIDLVIDPKPALKALGFGDYTMPLGAIYEPSHPITKDFSMATFYPLVRSLKISNQMNMVVSEIVKTTGESYADKTYLSERNVKFDPGVDTKGPICVVAAAAKTIQEAPAAPSTSENALKSDLDAEKSKKKEMRLVVAGTSNFVKNRFVNMQGNGNLTLNIINYLADEEDLIAIRPKTNTPQEKIDLTRQDADNIFYITLFLMPGIVVLSGFTVWFYRNK